LIAQGLAAFESYVRAAVQLREVAEWLPSNGFEFDLRALADADITGPSVNDPYGPVNQHVRLVEAADSLKLLLPVLGYEAMRTALDQVQSGSAHEAVVGGNVTDTIQSEPYDALLDELLDTGRSHIYCSDEKIPFYLGIAEDLDLVQIGVIDENRIPRGMIETDDPEVREWAERLFSKYKERARRIE
jgi:predicted transcriptional regulator